MSLSRTREARLHLLAIALSVLAGISLSIWLALDPPDAAPTRTTYLPAD